MSATEPAITPPVLTSMEHHTATITGVPEDYTGGTKKKRVRKTDSTIVQLYDDIRSMSRAYGIDELETQINRLQKAKELADAKVKRMTYDVPSVIRREIIEPTFVLKRFGIMPTESECITRSESIEHPSFQAFLSLLNRYKAGTPDALRLGAHAKYRITGISFDDAEELKEIACEALSDAIRAAHTRFIMGLGEADDALAAALKSEKELTEKEQDGLHAARANQYRMEIRAAHEELNMALASATKFDHDENVIDLLKGLRSIVASKRNSFNAAQALRGAKGVEV